MSLFPYLVEEVQGEEAYMDRRPSTAHSRRQGERRFLVLGARASLLAGHGVEERGGEVGDVLRDDGLPIVGFDAGGGGAEQAGGAA